MNSVDNTKSDYRLLDEGTIKAGEALHGESVCDDDPGRCSILVGGRLLTVEALQRLLNLREGFDLHLNGSLDLAGPDRVTESRAWYELDASSDWWQCSASILYAGDGSATPTTNGVRKTKLTGLGTPVRQYLLPNPDDDEILTAKAISIDIRGNVTESSTSVSRLHKSARQATAYPDSTTSAAQDSTNGLLMASTSKTGAQTAYSHDALGRQVSAVSRGPNRSVGSFTHYDSLGQVDWTMDAASNVTSYAYDGAGRRIAVTDALSNTTYTAYDAEGRVLGTWGATYPVAYEFDDFGRMSAMYTYRGTNSIASYTDLSNLKSEMDRTAWQYDLATGLLTNKVYADTNGTVYAYTPDGRLSRRTWARGVTTDYSYDSIGQMTNIVYSDGTPGVSLAYDRLGRQATIADGAGIRTFAYNDALQLAAETNAFGVFTRAYDALGRAAGFALGPDYSVAYGYDAVGRFSVVSNGAGGVATYSYLPGSDLLVGYDLASGTNVLAVRKSFEANRDLIAAVSNLWNGAAVAPFEYLNDALARRVRRVDNGSVTNDFGYNLRSELASAAMGTNRYGYAYDPIGNRLTATNNAEVLTYLANALNQYTNIADGVTNSPTYDADGNMLTCGPWVFSWDAENRLVLASNATTVVSNSYDYMSRRVSKSVTGSASQFLYDGWAMVREASGTTTNSYVYGLDLSGSMQGAGTIGGILSACLGGTNAFCAYDANGNLTDLVGADGGAHYEYDPYGNTIAKTGALADANPFRFSTKYLDDETALYYYGARFVSPEVGRWISRDPLQEGVVDTSSNSRWRWGKTGRVEIHHYTALANNPLNYVDPTGLAIINPRRLGDCSCKYEDVNKTGCAGGKKAFDAATAETFPADALLPGSRKREYCGRVCCNRKTKNTVFTGPVPGPWEKQYAGMVNGTPMYVYGYGPATCQPQNAPPCSTKGDDWEEAGAYHSHPSSPNFSSTDEDYVIAHAQPLFLYCNGSCSRMDPWVGTYVNGPTVINPFPYVQVCTVNPQDGSYTCTTPNTPSP